MSGANAMVGLLVGLLAFALVVQVKSNVGDSQLANARQDDLVRILSDLDAREQRLRAEVGTLEGTLGQLGVGRPGPGGGAGRGPPPGRRAGHPGRHAARRGAGPGHRLDPGAEPIPAATVLEAVEELRGAGAEAMQINGSGGAAVRIVASTYFVDGGGRHRGGRVRWPVRSRSW